MTHESVQPDLDRPVSESPVSQRTSPLPDDLPDSVAGRKTGLLKQLLLIGFLAAGGFLVCGCFATLGQITADGRNLPACAAGNPFASSGAAAQGRSLVSVCDGP